MFVLFWSWQERSLLDGSQYPFIECIHNRTEELGWRTQVYKWHGVCPEFHTFRRMENGSFRAWVCSQQATLALFSRWSFPSTWSLLAAGGYLKTSTSIPRDVKEIITLLEPALVLLLEGLVVFLSCFKPTKNDKIAEASKATYVFNHQYNNSVVLMVSSIYGGGGGCNGGGKNI